MKPLLITALLAVSAPAASANDFVDFHKKIFNAHRRIARAIFHTHRDVHRAAHWRIRARRVWVPVRYEIVRRQVYIPGTTERVWRPARYGTRYDNCGYSYRVLVSRGYWDVIRTPGRYVWRAERVRRGGYYRYRTHRR